MVRALGSASPREHAGAGDSGLGEEQPDLQACQAPLPLDAEHYQTPAIVENFTTDDKEDEIESITDTLLPDFSCLAVGSSLPPISDIDFIQHDKSPPLRPDDQYRTSEAHPEISANKTEAQTVTAAHLARSSPPAESFGPNQLSTLLIALAKQNLRLLDSLKQSNLVLSKLERDTSYFEVSAKLS